MEIHPCTEDGLVTLEARFDLSKLTGCTFADFVDSEQMCSTLEFLDFLDSLKCSPEMGYALAEWSGRRIHTFKGGKIIVRKAKNNEDAINVLRIFSRLLWGSIRCDCGQPVVKCLSGSCDLCDERICSCQILSPMEKTESSGKMTGASLFSHISGLPTANFFLESSEKLEEATKYVVANLCQKGQSDLAALGAMLDEASRLAVSFVVETERGLDSILGFILVGIASNIRSSVRDLSFVREDRKINEEVYCKAARIVRDGYLAFRKGKKEQVGLIRGNYEDLAHELEDGNPAIGFAAVGYHTARILLKPFPK